MFKKRKKNSTKKIESLPFTFAEGHQSLFQHLNYDVGLTTENPDVQLKILIPLVIQVERKGKPTAMVNLGVLKLEDLRELFHKRIMRMRRMNMIPPEEVTIPIDASFELEGETFNVLLKAEKEVKH